MPRAAPRIETATLPDGYRSAVRVWRPADPKGRVVFVHGIVSHGGWYLASCRHLASAGLEVHFMERRGSGLNRTARGDVDRYQTWLDDVESYLERLPEPLPVALCGISWGGQLAAAVARRRPDLLAGVAMICPGLFAHQFPNWIRRAGLPLAVALGLRRRRVTIPLQDPALFTTEPRWQRYLRDDPHRLRQVTIAMALANQRLNRYATEAPEQIRVPALLMLAGRDRIVDNHRTRAFFERVASGDKQFIEYPAAGHTLEFEPDRAVYFNDLTHWVTRVTFPQTNKGDHDG